MSPPVLIGICQSSIKMPGGHENELKMRMKWKWIWKLLWGITLNLSSRKKSRLLRVRSCPIYENLTYPMAIRYCDSQSTQYDTSVGHPWKFWSVDLIVKYKIKLWYLKRYLLLYPRGVRRREPFLRTTPACYSPWHQVVRLKKKVGNSNYESGKIKIKIKGTDTNLGKKQ